MSDSPIEGTADTADSAPAPALWNPNAAALWSVLFSPVFGAWLHALNWRALGDPARQRRSARWMLVGLAAAVFYIVVALAWHDPLISDRVSSATGLAYLLAWYLGPAREQLRVVRERHGDAYPRRPWGRVLMIGVGAMLGYFVLAGIVGVLAAGFAG
jgi:hypothetical protein